MNGSHRSYASLDRLRPGDHVCQFYSAVEDLADVLIPFFKAGLERRESCLWVAGDQRSVERAHSEMRTAIADFDRRAAAGQIQIISQDEWQTKYGALSVAETVQGWMSWKDAALASGYAGVRTGGDLSSRYERGLDAFLEYERAVDKEFRRQPIAAVCCYSLERCSGKAVFDVMEHHSYGLAKRGGGWRSIETRHQRSVHDAASRSQPDQTTLIEVAEEVLAIYMLAYPGRIRLEGVPAPLSALPAARLRMVLNELVANAAEFGALAVPQGSLDIKWHVAANGSRRVHVTWTERGMSGLTIPDVVGRGTRAIASAAENIVRTYEPTGLCYKFEVGL